SGLWLSPQGLRGHKALKIKRVFPREHVIHGATQLMRKYRERFGFAVFVFEFGKVRFPRLTLADEEHGGFGKSPAEMDVADLFAGSPQAFPARFFGAFHQATVGDEILHAGKPRNVLNLIENDQRQNLSDPWHGLEPRKRLHIVRFGTAREIQFHFAQQVVVVINERNVDLYRLVDTGIGEMLGDAFPIRSVRQSFADLWEIVLT